VAPVVAARFDTSIFKPGPFSSNPAAMSHFYYRRAANRRYGRGKYGEDKQ
jgi:hypothetical protein